MYQNLDKTKIEEEMLATKKDFEKTFEISQ
jgi:hypothetical protein